jgi:glycosyltransferase involved in cell wall biosynthesis
VKIVVHCVYFPPEFGGLESHVFYLCRALVEMGHEVEVVTSRSMEGLPTEEEMEGIRVWRTWFPSRSPAGWVGHSVGSVPTLLARAADADILHAQAFASVPPCLLASSMGGRRIPVVSTLHTSHFLTRARKRVWRPILGELVRRPDYSLAASTEIAHVAEALAPGVRVEALTNGVETELFKPVPPALPPADGRRIVVPRRLFEKNWVEFFVRAFPAIREAHPGVEAILVGDGPERGRLEALAEEVGAGSGLRFLGPRPNHEMPAILSSADLAVFPSLMEATSVAALECLSCEVPVAASRVGGLPEIVDDSVGGLFEPGDPGDLARVVSQLLGRPDLGALGRAGRTRVREEWSNRRLALRHLEIYRALLDGRRPESGPGPRG